MNVQGFKVGVFGDASYLEGAVRFGDGPDGDLVRVYSLWNWCEPSVSEVDLGRVLRRCSCRVFSWASDAPLGIEKVEKGYGWFNSTQSPFHFQEVGTVVA